MKVLFVCTGNIFRSMSAEYCFKKFLEDKGIDTIQVSSAGTNAIKHSMWDSTLTSLISLGANPTQHVQRRLNDEILAEQDLVIAMSKDHRDFIQENFGIKVPLFNEIAYHKNKALPDIWEKYEDYKTNLDATNAYIHEVINFINDSMPHLYENLEEFTDKFPKSPCVFCEFLEGKRKEHKHSKFPFMILNETKHSISFLSEDIPLNKDAHVLVIPKNHHAEIELMPPEELHDLIEHVSLTSKVLKRSHGACNVLQNDGKSAGQCVFHVHFHLIPRDKGDGIEIELWEKGKFPKVKYLQSHDKLKELYKDIDKPAH